METGLYIHNKRIRQLSGIFSIRYLRPKQDQFMKLASYGVKLPLMLLLGDKHFSMDGMCGTCTCEDGGCCEITDHTLLRDLDSLAFPEHPVDFYVESFLHNKDSTDPDDKIGPLDLLLSGSFRICYNRMARGTPEYEECPTKHIRWQYADARQSLFLEKYEGTIEASFTALFRYLMGETSYLENIQDYTLKLVLFLYDEVDHKLMIRLFCELFFKVATSQTSVLFKQIMKQEYPLLRDRDYLVEMMEKGLSRILNRPSTLNSATHLHEIIRFVMDRKKESDRNPELHPQYDKDKMTQIAGIVGDINMIFLDLYFLLRTFKLPTKSTQASLCIGYFGALHTLSISYLLTDVLGLYDRVILKYHDQHNERCVSVPFIDLSEEVRLHNQLREIKIPRIQQHYAGYMCRTDLLLSNYQRARHSPTSIARIRRMINNTSPPKIKKVNKKSHRKSERKSHRKSEQKSHRK